MSASSASSLGDGQASPGHSLDSIVSTSYLIFEVRAECWKGAGVVCGLDPSCEDQGRWQGPLSMPNSWPGAFQKRTRLRMGHLHILEELSKDFPVRSADGGL